MEAVFVRNVLVEKEPPPADTRGFTGWARQHLFSSVGNSLLTLFGAFLVVSVLYELVHFLFLSAVYSAPDAAPCRVEGAGACWPFITAKFRLFMFGFYPIDQVWRIELTYVLAVILLVPLLVPSAPYKVLNAILFFGIFPLVAFALLVGGPVLHPPLAVLSWIGSLGAIGIGTIIVLMAFARRFDKRIAIAFAASLALWYASTALLDSGVLSSIALPFVETRQWGGFLISLVVSVTGISAALPIGIMLALGRRSKLPIIRTLSVGFIEMVRGVPLITVLFFSTYILPQFLTNNPDALVRVLLGVSLFAGAYMAEVIRGGLQAISKGQFEGAAALGLNTSQTMGLIILPQALKIVIPGIVNTFIGLFKDTTLVSIVAIFDLLGQLRTGFADPQWSSPVTLFTGFAFAGFIYFIFCFAISRYSLFIEKKLNTSHKR
jgi:general L-amino acid transport system permease protein